MRIGFLGALRGGDVATLEGAARFLLEDQKVQRVIYLGADDALERCVVAWARRLVGEDPSEDAVWRSAARLAKSGTPDEIDAFVRAHRMRQKLRSLESLPHRILRTMEMVGDRIAVLVHDKASLDDEDVYAASFILYGRSEAPLMKRLGDRWFVTPGPLGEGSGVCVLDEAPGAVHATLFDATGREMQRETLHITSKDKLRVQSAEAKAADAKADDKEPPA